MTSSTSNPHKKKRIRVWTAEDRAAHRLFEKSRREAFNDGLIDLARQIPSLASMKRLNKHLIVEHSIKRHKEQRQLRCDASQELRRILAERDDLLTEVNHWRSLSRPSIMPRKATPMGTSLKRLLNSKKEQYGSFPNGFGENPTEGVSSDDREEINRRDNMPNTSHTGTIASQTQQSQDVPNDNIAISHQQGDTAIGVSADTYPPDLLIPELGPMLDFNGGHLNHSASMESKIDINIPCFHQLDMQISQFPSLGANETNRNLPQQTALGFAIEDSTDTNATLPGQPYGLCLLPNVIYTHETMIPTSKYSRHEN
ncbi:hypothetical protein BS50DRAFT_615012 [Corynespora cassiicola Philippines]|uniref:BHLH domain-containing protein n=1 Tax=Corynespora cassiicola Philippines TaxID=1448308 RepID=A0A2T2P8P8_CORCC|nr:hypothetical protein BS50DRAFT_615012 [Corynespora cassiicola Philippines]